MLTPEAYALERAIVDKANAYWDSHATFGRGGGSSMSSELCAHPDYAACDNAMRGRVEQYEILTNPPERLSAYVGEPLGDGAPLDKFGDRSRRSLTVWTGDQIGAIFLGKGWRSTSYIGSRMYQAHATIAGRRYTGRTFGEGMLVNLRETAASRRARNV